MNGKLIVLEGTDASGKSTQFERLTKSLENEGHSLVRLAFPQYSEPSSALIRMYLSGEFGKNPNDVNPYAAATFFAVDRYASYKKVWKDEYERGKTVLADRYVTSNAIHQGAKLDKNEQEAYFSWLYDFEYRLLGLPVPDAVIFLDMPPDAEQELLKKRTEKKMDIHESDSEYLKKCYETAVALCKKWNFIRIDCVKNGKIRSIDDIQNEIFILAKQLLGGNNKNASV
ncbi:MAG: thymidylate kinase [Bacillota bacterium]|nr:thymidylate kinase [Bacillota bacterium]